MSKESNSVVYVLLVLITVITLISSFALIQINDELDSKNTNSKITNNVINMEPVDAPGSGKIMLNLVDNKRSD